MTKEEFVTYFHWLHTEYKAGEKHASTVATTVATTMATTIATTVFEAHSLPQNTEKRTEKFIDDVEKRSVIWRRVSALLKPFCSSARLYRGRCCQCKAVAGAGRISAIL